MNNILIKIKNIINDLQYIQDDIEKILNKDDTSSYSSSSDIEMEVELNQQIYDSVFNNNENSALPK